MTNKKCKEHGLGVEDTPTPLRSRVAFGLGRHHHPIAAGHATSMKHQEIR